MGVCSAQSASAIHSLSLRQLPALCVSALSLPSICMSIVFRKLQNPFTATLFLSHLYKTPPGCGGAHTPKVPNVQLSTIDCGLPLFRRAEREEILRAFHGVL